MTINEFTEIVFEKFEEQITDEIFHFIENDKDLFHSYLHLIESNKLNVLNSSIAKAIKKRYDLTNKAQDNAPEKTKLIKSHTSFISKTK